MFNHLLSDYRLFFEGMPAPVFYKSFYPMGCETDGQWEMLRYAQGLKADKDPERHHFDTYKRDVRDLLADVSADFPGRKVGAVAIPSSKAGNVNRVTKLLRRGLAWADDRCVDLTGCLVRCESKKGAHEGGSRSVAANVSTLRFDGAERMEDIDVLLVVDDILTSGKSFRAVDGIVRSAGFSGTIVNFAFSRTMPGVCIDEYVRFAYGERAAGRRCETFNSLVLDLDQTLIDDAAKDDDYEEGLWGGGGVIGPCPYSVYPGAEDLTALGVPYAVISNRPKRELDAILRDPSISDAFFHKGTCEAETREGDWWGVRLVLARLTRNHVSQMPPTDNVFGPPRSEDRYKKWIYKPNPEGVGEALGWLSREALEGERVKAIGLGNTPEDMLAYRAAGITAALALWGVPSWCREHAAENWGADCVFESPSAFADWFRCRCESAPMPDSYRLDVEEEGEPAAGFYGAAVEYGVSEPQAAARPAAGVAPDEQVHSVCLLEKRLARGDFLDSALALARLLAGANPDKAMVLYGMAVGAGSVDAARELSSLVQAEDPDWAVLLLDLAYELGESDADLASDLEPLVKQGVESAISLYEGKLVEANLRSPVDLAALVSESDPERAKALCERAIVAGDERWATYLLACLVQSDDPERAIALYERAIAAGDEEFATSNLADLAKSDDPERAKALYERAIAAGNERYATNGLANLIKVDDPERARSLFERAIAAGDERYATSNLANFIEPDDPERAKELYERAIAAGNERYATYGLASLIEIDDPERARSLYERAIAGGNTLNAAYNLAMLVKDADVEPAKQLFQMAIDAGDEYESTFQLAMLIEKSNPAQAKSLYGRSVAAGNAYASSARLADLLKDEDRARAADLYQQAIDAGNVSAYAKLARLVSGDNRSRAIELCEKAMAEGDVSDAPFFLAWLLEKEDPERSKDLYQQCVDRGNCYSATNNLGWLIREDDPDRAEALYERAIAAGDEYYATCNLANLVKSDDPDRAEALFERAIAAGNVADAAYDLALLLEPNDPERSKSLYERAIAAGDERWATNSLANLVREDDPERARELYERAIAAGNEDSATSNLGCLICKDDPERAKSLYERAMASGDERCAPCNLAHILIASDPEGAKSLYEGVLAYGEAEAMLGLAYLLRGSDPARSAGLISEAKQSEGLAEAVDFIEESLSAVPPDCAIDMKQFLLEKGIG